MRKFIFFILWAIPLFSFTQTKNNGWNYSEFWEKSKSWTYQTSYEEKLSDCQIPEKLLSEMTTEGLVSTCLNFPFLLDIYAFDNVQEGFDRITSNFNGFIELYKRDKAATVLLEHYRKIKSEHLNNPDLLDIRYKNMRGKFVIDLDNIELLLAQNEILLKLTDNEKILLAKECIQKHDEKCKNNDLFGIDNIHSTVLILGRLLQLEGEYHFKNIELNTTESIKKGKLEKIGSFNEIIENAKIYISKQ
jgi:hypothetical protein